MASPKPDTTAQSHMRWLALSRCRAERLRHRNDDPHLRSCTAVTGYKLGATVGEIGTVAAYLVDDLPVR